MIHYFKNIGQANPDFSQLEVLGVEERPWDQCHHVTEIVTR